MSALDIASLLANLPRKPGVYQMLGDQEQVLYVGKAADLKARVSSYFRSTGLTIKTQALVKRIQRVQITVTHSETEALLLEQSLIKELRPPYNILLRDDKSYPYIFISSLDTYPAIRFHRGPKRKKGRYFGPYPSSSAVKDSLHLLQKIFKLRPCEDAVFNNRSRPCLQYQIKRCNAPCVEFIQPEEYQKDLEHALMFLQGKNASLLQDIQQQMEQASMELAFERAAELRDQLISLQKVQEQQFVIGAGGEADVLAAQVRPGGGCVHVLYVRQGRIQGSRTYYPKLAVEADEAQLLSAFIPQFYLGSQERELPPELLLSHEPQDKAVLAEALSAARERKVSLNVPQRGEKSQWLKLAETNAQDNLAAYLASQNNLLERFVTLQEVLGLDELPHRIECFDISHSQGEATVASCVVFNAQGAVKQDYRRFNIEGITPGDDYAAMHQALTRRYARLSEEGASMPSILLVDGGKGQLAQARQVLAELGIEEIQLVGVAKGVTRKPGLETLWLEEDNTPLILERTSPALHLIQQVRDEAHRFAISGHRARRGKARRVSSLEGIAGVGPKKRQALLRHFGGIQGVQRASMSEIAKVPGISQALAQDIYDHLHPGGAENNDVD
ncbi:excinuclease ABC subunit UvrC [Balneatrix alpica]|uniref:UvrABC system protein C n=1 Tax=Balneatrix alpica TaxID=75684 RepID=A0ABV5Z8S5_9GAMM|nr:excinuclease ABC subunit UvrC [Balneatrix alpica]